MAKTTTLRERGSLQPLYPKTISSQVILPDGHNLDHELSKQSNVLAVPTENRIEEIEPGIITEALRKVPQVLTPEEQEQVKANIGVSKMELFIDLWDEACGTYGKYDPANAPDPDHPFYLNTLWLTYEEAVAVMILPVMNPSNLYRLYHDVKTARTHMPTLSYMSVSAGDGTFNGSSFEVIEAGSISVGRGMFKNCNNLRRVSIYAPNNNTLIPDIWSGCAKLENVEFSVVYRTSFSLSDSPLLSLPTAQRIVSKTSASGAAFIISVHPDVYAKLTDEANTQWHQVLIDAAEKNINFATV